jgi:hypothetical protein
MDRTTSQFPVIVQNLKFFYFPWVHFLDPPAPWSVIPLTSARMANLICFLYNKICVVIFCIMTPVWQVHADTAETYSAYMLKHLYTQHWCLPTRWHCYISVAVKTSFPVIIHILCKTTVLRFNIVTKTAWRQHKKVH